MIFDIEVLDSHGLHGLDIKGLPLVESHHLLTEMSVKGCEDRGNHIVNGMSLESFTFPDDLIQINRHVIILKKCRQSLCIIAFRNQNQVVDQVSVRIKAVDQCSDMTVPFIGIIQNLKDALGPSTVEGHIVIKESWCHSLSDFCQLLTDPALVHFEIQNRQALHCFQLSELKSVTDAIIRKSHRLAVNGYIKLRNSFYKASKDRSWPHQILADTQIIISDDHDVIQFGKFEMKRNGQIESHYRIVQLNSLIVAVVCETGYPAAFRQVIQ